MTNENESLTISSEAPSHASISPHAAINPHGIKSVSPADLIDRNDLTGEPNWYWSKDVPGDGDRPEWLPEGKTVEDLAKRADGLRKQLSQHGKYEEETEEVPDNSYNDSSQLEEIYPDNSYNDSSQLEEIYPLNVDEEIAEKLGIDNDDPMILDFRKIAKEIELEPDAFSRIMNLYIDNQAKNVIDHMTNNEEECKKLGLNPDKAYDQIDNWADHNLEPDDAEILKNCALSAPEMKVILGIINKFSNINNIPSDIYADPASLDEQRREAMSQYMNGGIGTLKKINELYGVKS